MNKHNKLNVLYKKIERIAAESAGISYFFFEGLKFGINRQFLCMRGSFDFVIPKSIDILPEGKYYV